MTEQEDNEEDLVENVLGSSASKPRPFNDPIPDREIGHITAQDEGLQIGREENIVRAVVQPNERDRVQVGDYIRVPYYRPDEAGDSPDVNQQMLASVLSLRYIQHQGLSDRQLTSADTFGAEQYVYLATLDPIATITLDDDYEEEEPFTAEFVSAPPRPTVKLDKVDESEFLRCGLEVPKNGIYIGDMAVNSDRIPSEDDPLEYFLFNPNASDGTSGDGEASIFRHVLVAGSTGTGKTHTSKNILRQFAKCKKYNIDVPAEDETTNQEMRERALNLTIIDPEDEYTEMANDPEDIDAVEEMLESRNGVEYGGITDRADADFKVYAPVLDDVSAQPSTNGIEYNEFGIPFGIVHYHHELLMPNDPQGPTAQAIHEVLNDFFREFEPEDATYEEFESWLAARGEDYEARLGESIFGAVERRVTQSVYSRVFDNGNKQLLDDGFAEEMFADGQVTVITTGHLRGQPEDLIIQSLLSHIVENKISSNVEEPHIKGTPMVLALDEAHEYLNEPETTREFFIVDKFRRAARRGRKDLFGLYFISQNPEDIDGEVRNQMNTKIFLQLDARVANSGDVYVPFEFVNQVPNFELGQMVVSQPNVRDVEVRGLPMCLTQHDS